MINKIALIVDCWAKYFFSNETNRCEKSSQVFCVNEMVKLCRKCNWLIDSICKETDESTVKSEIFLNA